MLPPEEAPVIADNEAVYDNEINPLMKRILEICKAHNIPMVAAFEYAPEQLCTSFILPKGSCGSLVAASEVVHPSRIMAFTITSTRDDA